MKMRSWGWTRSFALGLALAGGASHLYAGGPSVPGKPATRTKSVSSETSSWTAPVAYQDPGMMPPGMMPPGMMQPGMMQPGMMPNPMMHQVGYNAGPMGPMGPMPAGPMGPMGPMPAGPMGPMGPMPGGPMPYGPMGPVGMDGQDMVFHGPPPAGLEGECDSPYGSGYCQDGSCGGACGSGHCGGGILGGGGLLGGGGCCPSCGGMGGGCGHCGPIRKMLACGPFGGALACRNGDCGGFHSGILPGLAGLLLPYGEGGVCAQRWYDISVGGMALRRTKQGGQNINLSSQGIGGPIILSTDDLSLDQSEWGLNLLVAVQVGPGGSVEVSYFGLNNWDTTARVTSNNPDIYSVFSDFGQSPFNGFDDPDRSFVHSATYRSAIQNGEVNYRRRWVGPYCWFQGSWLAGLRYFDLDEAMDFSTAGQLNNAQNQGLRFLNQTTETRNALTGVQVGGDLWMNVIPGLHLGTEFKTGIFGNVAETNTSIVANSIADYTEFASDATTAYMGEIAFKTVYRINYNWSFSAGYHIMQVDNVALAPVNFNTAPPPDFNGPVARTPFIDNNQNVTYEGYTLGLEYIW
jgi:hypothetical protein